MTLKAKIIGELLGSLDDPGGPEGVLRRYGHSKGPLYSALAEATSRLRQEMEDLLEEASRARGQREGLQAEVEGLEESRLYLEEEVQSLEKRIIEAQEKLGRAQGLLDRAGDLTRRGLGEDELLKLGSILEEIAVTHGADPREVVHRFLRVAEGCTDVVSLGAMAKETLEQKGALEREMAVLEGQVEALILERDGLHAAVRAVTEQGLAEVKLAGELARQHVEQLSSAGFAYGNLRAEAAALGEHLVLARGLRSEDPQVWSGMSRKIIQHILGGAAMWVEVPGRDVPVGPPESVGVAYGLTRYTLVRVSHLLLWALAGTFTLDERDDEMR